jgi:hypothetical protein
VRRRWLDRLRDHSRRVAAVETRVLLGAVYCLVFPFLAPLRLRDLLRLRAGTSSWQERDDPVQTAETLRRMF